MLCLDYLLLSPTDANKVSFFLDNHTFNQYKHEHVIAAKQALVYGTKISVYNTPQKKNGWPSSYIHGSEWAK